MAGPTNIVCCVLSFCRYSVSFRGFPIISFDSCSQYTGPIHARCGQSLAFLSHFRVQGKRMVVSRFVRIGLSRELCQTMIWQRNNGMVSITNVIFHDRERRIAITIRAVRPGIYLYCTTSIFIHLRCSVRLQCWRVSSNRYIGGVRGLRPGVGYLHCARAHFSIAMEVGNFARLLVDEYVVRWGQCLKSGFIVVNSCRFCHSYVRHLQAFNNIARRRCQFTWPQDLFLGAATINGSGNRFFRRRRRARVFR